METDYLVEETAPLKPLYIEKQEAAKRNMSPHAGPYNMNMLRDVLMLKRCLDDFKLRPERKFALVKTATSSDGDLNARVQIERTSIWADGFQSTPKDYVPIRLEREKELQLLREIFGR